MIEHTNKRFPLKKEQVEEMRELISDDITRKAHSNLNKIKVTNIKIH